MFGDFPAVPRKTLLLEHRDICEEAYELCESKNYDYAGSDEAFGNLRICDDWGMCPVEVGLLIRMADKLKRLANLIHGKTPAVEDEKMKDSLLDIINYAVFLVLALDLRTQHPSYQPHQDHDALD